MIIGTMISWGPKNANFPGVKIPGDQKYPNPWDNASWGLQIPVTRVVTNPKIPVTQVVANRKNESLSMQELRNPREIFTIQV